MSKAQKTTTIIIACLFAFLSIFVLFWYFGESYKEFYSQSTKEFEIAGLKEGFTPQGLAYDENSKQFLSCGYMKNGSASRIYVVDAKSKETVKYFTLKNEDVIYTGHAGGIATDGTNVWIVGDGTVYRFDFAKIADVENGGNIEIVDSFTSNNGADFVTVEGNLLWVGEFQRDGKYDVPQTHFVETSNGKINKALSFCYEIDSASQFGIKSTTPIKALSTPSLVQGMVVVGNKVVISTSYSLPNSHIYTHDNVFNSTNKTFDYEGTPIPLFVLEDQNQTSDLEAPSMSEEIVVADGRIFISFESACQKYGFVTREPLRHVYSIAL